jgi:hypothetical protein
MQGWDEYKNDAQGNDIIWKFANDKFNYLRGKEAHK